jgi:hypothetical protein
MIKINYKYLILIIYNLFILNKVFINFFTRYLLLLDIDKLV